MGDKSPKSKSKAQGQKQVKGSAANKAPAKSANTPAAKNKKK